MNSNVQKSPIKIGFLGVVIDVDTSFYIHLWPLAYVRLLNKPYEKDERAKLILKTKLDC